MKHTLVAAFRTATDANRTQGDLMSRGIPREQIHAVGAESAEIHAYDAPYSAAGDTLDRSHHESKVAHFFKSLFGSHSHDEYRHHAVAYPEAVRRGARVIAVDVYSDDELLKARDALEYNGAIDINEDGASGTAASASLGYPGPSSPYAGATGGDSHLDRHFSRPTSGAATGAMASGERYSESEPPRAGGPIGSAAGSGRTSDGTSTLDTGSRSADTGRYDIGSAAKRAGTDYPSTTATTAPTGAGTTGHGANAGLAATGATGGQPATGSDRAGPCSERVCVIRWSDDDNRPL